MSHSVTVKHNMETGHRLPHLTGKCSSLHGHSWNVEWTISSPKLAADGTVVEFGALKKLLREWVDVNLDHGLMLGLTDPLDEILGHHGKVFTFGFSEPSDGLDWPTVENVAVLLGRVAEEALTELRRPHYGWSIPSSVRCTRVVVSETAVNTATWDLDPERPKIVNT